MHRRLFCAVPLVAAALVSAAAVEAVAAEPRLLGSRNRSRGPVPARTPKRVPSYKRADSKARGRFGQ